MGGVQRKMPAVWAQMVCLDNDWGQIATCSGKNPAQISAGENAVYLIYTSGSTGYPKGVVVTHAGLACSTNERLRYYHASEPVFLLLSSISFDSSAAGLYHALCGSGRFYLRPPDFGFEIAYLTRLIGQHLISHILMLPSVYRLLLSNEFDVRSFAPVSVGGGG